MSRIPLVIEAMRVQTRDGDKPDPVRTAIVQAGAHATSQAAFELRVLSGKISDAIEKLEDCHTVRDAWLVMVWLRGGAWDSLRDAITRLETCSMVLQQYGSS